MNEQTLTIVRDQLADPAFADAHAEGRRLTPEEAVALALDT